MKRDFDDFSLDIETKFNDVVVKQPTGRKARDRVDKTGELIFLPEDVYKTSHPLARILRSMFVDNNITVDYLKRKHSEHCDAMGMDAYKKNQQRNNFKTTLKAKTMTYPFFEDAVSIIFGYQIKNLEFEFLTSNGEIRRYNLKDIDNITCINV